MCGIVGIFSNDSIAEMALVVKKMKHSIAHRGPDDSGEWIQKGVGLGHRRLSIIDVSANGHQPMLSSDGKIVVAFNGEIYNYIELKEELKGHYQFRTGSDTEVIIAAYIFWGEQFVDHLNGMFAIALYDANLDALLLCRDRLGEKPLYYFKSDQAIIFSSEIRSILSSGKMERRLDDLSLQEYIMTQTVSFPKTIVKDVFAVMPGRYMKITREGAEEMRYWNFNEGEFYLKDKEDAKFRVQEELRRSVEWRMRADVSFGAFLSGGLDSSILVALMADISNQPIHTFSIGFEEKAWDESPIAEMVAQRFKTHHTKVVLNGNHFLDELESAVAAMDHPSGDGVNSFVVSKVTRNQGIKMAMSGLGGDEVFGGYPIFNRIKNSAKFRKFAWLPGLPIDHLDRLLLLKWNGVQIERIAHFLNNSSLSDEAMFNAERIVNGRKSMRQLLKNYSDFQLDRTWHDWGEDKTYSSVSEAEMKSYMTHVLLRDGDQMSMANALEIRVPFLDHQLIELVMSIPDSWKRGIYPKQLLIDAFEEWIPKQVYERKKQGFAFPWQSWMLHDLNDYCNVGLFELTHRTDLDEKVIQGWWQLFNQQDKRVPWNKIWHLVVLGHWMKNNEING